MARVECALGFRVAFGGQVCKAPRLLASHRRVVADNCGSQAASPMSSIQRRMVREDTSMTPPVIIRSRRAIPS